MKKLITNVGVLGLTFGLAFLVTTAFCDWVCWHSSYYIEAQNEAVVLED